MLEAVGGDLGVGWLPRRSIFTSSSSFLRHVPVLAQKSRGQGPKATEVILLGWWAPGWMVHLASPDSLFLRALT